MIDRRLLRQRILVATVLALLLGLGGCAWMPSRSPGIGPDVSWHKLPGWAEDRHAEVWPALLRSCRKLEKTSEQWRKLCTQASALGVPSDDQARSFFEKWFTPHYVNGNRGRRSGLITGYYEPLLRADTKPSQRYRYALYRRPSDLVRIELAELYPELKGKRIRGKLVGNKVVPYPSRAEIDGNSRTLAGSELLWVDDPIALFFLHIQGSGRIELPDGRMASVGYADQNGHPYVSIGRELVRMGELELAEVDLFSIRDWLRRHPERAHELLFRNPSYVFFELRDAAQAGPLGSLNVPLTPERSIAVDRGVIPLGLPVWLDTRLPGNKHPYRRLVIAQDTGGAIRGPVRVDLFWGRGDRAERMAGRMKQAGRIFVLIPKANP